MPSIGNFKMISSRKINFTVMSIVFHQAFCKHLYIFGNKDIMWSPPHNSEIAYLPSTVSFSSSFRYCFLLVALSTFVAVLGFYYISLILHVIKLNKVSTSNEMLTNNGLSLWICLYIEWCNTATVIFIY